MFSMGQNVGLQVGRLGKAFAAEVEGTVVGPVPCVNPDVGPQVEV